MKAQEKKRQQGQSLTEFAVGLTFILIMLASGMDLGRAYYSYITVRDAAQEGASYASIAPSDVHGVRARVRSTSSTPVDLSSFTDDQIDIQVVGTACAGGTVKVTVEFDFGLVAPFIAGNSLHLQADAIDTILQPPC
ncbi:MAG: pilus assembly protein [Anaerolineales bacterium]|nr:MAG: pilus assembly protein [Anaerolineales bacterium]